VSNIAKYNTIQYNTIQYARGYKGLEEFSVLLAEILVSWENERHIGCLHKRAREDFSQSKVPQASIGTNFQLQLDPYNIGLIWEAYIKRSPASVVRSRIATKSCLHDQMAWCGGTSPYMVVGSKSVRCVIVKIYCYCSFAINVLEIHEVGAGRAGVLNQ
jgi:hypothetical protein